MAGTYCSGTLDDEKQLAVASGGPMDGTSLAATGAERYEVRMADETLHLYLRPDVTVPEGVVFRHAGRI